MQRAARMKRELTQLASDLPQGLCCWQKDDRIDILEASIQGPQGTPYEGGVFRVDFDIPERYPFEAPKARFVTPIYHPNVDESGRICHDILKMPPKGAWNPSHNVASVLTSLQLLLIEANPDDGLMADISMGTAPMTLT
eukprot:Opistho-2@13332